MLVCWAGMGRQLNSRQAGSRCKEDEDAIVVVNDLISLVMDWRCRIPIIFASVHNPNGTSSICIRTSDRVCQSKHLLDISCTCIKHLSFIPQSEGS